MSLEINIEVSAKAMPTLNALQGGLENVTELHGYIACVWSLSYRDLDGGVSPRDPGRHSLRLVGPGLDSSGPLGRIIHR
ncbi:MAG: hypothetical protein Q8M07_17115 [Prosthecobacter sp.]|nr:hypothetical protein [Prosthecobacter sp.]